MTGYAQRGRGEDVDREKLESARVAFITNRLSLTSDQAEKFWPIYNKHNESRREYMSELHRISREAGDNPSEAKAKELIDRRFQIQEDMFKDEKAFMKEITKVITSVQAFKLSEANRDFTRQIYQMQRRGPN
jgi:Spy/CpxP family protein refolding chaperone